MATTNLELKLAQAKVLNGALVLNVIGTGGVVLTSRAVGGNRYNSNAVAGSENDVKTYFGIPFSFVVNKSVSSITAIEVLSYDFNGKNNTQRIFRVDVDVPVESDDVVYVNEVSFTLLD